MGMMEFRCSECGVAVSGPVRELQDVRLVQTEAGEDYLPQGYFMVQLPGDNLQGLGHPMGRAPGAVLLNLKDLRNTRRVIDLRRLNGCCGLDGCDGPNTECIHGHEIGTEISDCWTPHYLHLKPGAAVPEKSNSD